MGEVPRGNSPTKPCLIFEQQNYPLRRGQTVANEVDDGTATSMGQGFVEGIKRRGSDDQGSVGCPAL